jgi:hypothetical protein
MPGVAAEAGDEDVASSNKEEKFKVLKKVISGGLTSQEINELEIPKDVSTVENRIETDESWRKFNRGP